MNKFFCHTKLEIIFAKSERFAQPVEKKRWPLLFSIYLKEHVNFFFTNYLSISIDLNTLIVAVCNRFGNIFSFLRDMLH